MLQADCLFIRETIANELAESTAGKSETASVEIP